MVQKMFGSENILRQKNVGPRKMWSEKMLVQKILCLKTFGCDKIWGANKLASEFFLGPKKFGV